MRTVSTLESWRLSEYQKEYPGVPQILSTGLASHLIDSDKWYKDSQHLYFEDRIVLPEA